jgi:DNA-binding CsgD family transcriptional regulator
MTDLSSRDYERMVDLAVALLDSPQPGPPWSHVIGEIIEPLHGEMIALVDLQWAGTGRVEACAPDELEAGRGRVEACAPDELELDALFGRQLHEHPFVGHYIQVESTPDGPYFEPVTTNDLIDELSWRSTPSYSDMRSTLGVTRQLSLPLRASPGAHRGFVIARNGRDFTDHDRAFARRVQPLFGRIDSHLLELQRLREFAPPGPAACREERAAAVGLTPRELTVLALLAEGLTAAAISRRLAISYRTVNTHLENLYRKLGTADRLRTVLLAQDLGLVPVRTR